MLCSNRGSWDNGASQYFVFVLTCWFFALFNFWPTWKTVRQLWHKLLHWLFLSVNEIFQTLLRINKLHWALHFCINFDDLDLMSWLQKYPSRWVTFQSSSNFEGLLCAWAQSCCLWHVSVFKRDNWHASWISQIFNVGCCLETLKWGISKVYMIITFIELTLSYHFLWVWVNCKVIALERWNRKVPVFLWHYVIRHVFNLIQLSSGQVKSQIIYFDNTKNFCTSSACLRSPSPTLFPGILFQVSLFQSCVTLLNY